MRNNLKTLSRVILLLAFVQLQSVSADVVQTQTVDGVTLRIKDARWLSTATDQPARNSEQEQRDHTFVLAFDLLKDGAVLPPAKTLKELVQAFRSGLLWLCLVVLRSLS